MLMPVSQIESADAPVILAWLMWRIQSRKEARTMSTMQTKVLTHTLAAVLLAEAIGAFLIVLLTMPVAYAGEAAASLAFCHGPVENDTAEGVYVGDCLMNSEIIYDPVLNVCPRGTIECQFKAYVTTKLSKKLEETINNPDNHPWLVLRIVGPVRNKKSKTRAN
jgi:hypothetical protein